MSDDPPPLRNDPSAPADLRRALALAQQSVPEGYDGEAALRSLHQAIDREPAQGRRVTPVQLRLLCLLAAVLALAVIAAFLIPRPDPLTTSAPAQRILAEREVVDRARALLPTDPATALALVEDEQKRHGDDPVAEDREALAVQALARLGRREQARARGEAFLGRWPDGARAAEVRAALQVAAP